MTSIRFKLEDGSVVDGSDRWTNKIAREALKTELRARSPKFRKLVRR